MVGKSNLKSAKVVAIDKPMRKSDNDTIEIEMNDPNSMIVTDTIGRITIIPTPQIIEIPIVRKGDYPDDDDDDYEETEEERINLLHLRDRSNEFGRSLSVLSFMAANKGRKPRDITDLNCWDKFIFRWFKPKKMFFYSAHCIREYKEQIDAYCDPLLKEYDWPVLPAGQHVKATGCNYLTHKLWMITFATTIIDFDQIQEEKEDYYREYYEELLTHTESVGIRLAEYPETMEYISDIYDYFGHIAKLLDRRLRKKKVRTLIKGRSYHEKARNLFEDTFLVKSRYDLASFKKLQIYTRDTTGPQWFPFLSLPYDKQIERIQKGINDIIEIMETTFETLPLVLELLKNADVKQRRVPHLVPHIKQMEESLKQLLKNRHFDSREEKVIQIIFDGAQSNVKQIIEKCFKLVNSSYEFVLAMRINYEFLTKEPNSHNTIATFDAMQNHWGTDVATRHHKLVSPYIRYGWEEYYNSDCPDILRKLPVVMGKNIEMGLHHEGHVNAPGKKLRRRRRTSVSPKKSSQPTASQKREVLRELRLDPASLQAEAISNTKKGILKKTAGQAIQMPSKKPPPK